MKRSQINQLIRETRVWLAEMKVNLPPFAHWTPEEWATKVEEYNEIRENMLGWDVTDYGHGYFANTGLILFTIRNGNLKNPQFTKPYAEKMLISQVNQIAPNHFHWNKMEDIINRGGGNLKIQVWNATETEELDQLSPVSLRIDGRSCIVPAGHVVPLTPGESITLPSKLYHMFWAEGTTCLAWEVSMMNDDNTDNRFHQEQLRFTAIEEDEPPAYYLSNEYPKAPKGE